jgi:hypothetical protein|tara:strand:- start:177 stop:440 length:264 start_codon:yes stop_codon:yes gene_type:complete
MNALNMQADAQARAITRETLHSVLLKQAKPKAVLLGQHDKTLEYMVLIDHTTKCECVKPSHDNDHQCARFFRDVQSAIAFEMRFNRK